jgi:hypothetical protein
MNPVIKVEPKSKGTYLVPDGKEKPQLVLEMSYFFLLYIIYSLNNRHLQKILKTIYSVGCHVSL